MMSVMNFELLELKLPLALFSLLLFSSSSFSLFSSTFELLLVFRPKLRRIFSNASF